MSLSDRDYMYETYEEKQEARKRRIDKLDMRNELWYLYGKKHKTRRDRQRIKEIEYYNLNGSLPPEKKKFFSKKSRQDKHNDIPFDQVILSCLLVIVFVIYIYVNYFA